MLNSNYVMTTCALITCVAIFAAVWRLFVSSNAWAALGATWFGFTTHWVNRQGLPFEALKPEPHFSGSDLNSVLVSLEK